ncbi:MAG: MBL fold metallo-hydrolase [Clostridia bacterium]
MSITINSQLANGYFEENSFIITDDATGESAIVDPCFYNFKSIILPEKIKYILLTHGHIDHIAHVNAVVKKCGGLIVSHKDEKDILKSSELNLTNKTKELLSIKPDVFLNDGDILTLGESKITLMHTPGHTTGSSCYIIDMHMFTGDTVISGTVGRCDLPTGNFDIMKKSIDKIKKLKGDFVIYCGHGQNSTLDFERNYNPYFR